MGVVYVKVMDKLYWLCIGIGILSVLIMTVLITTGVVMRYVFNLGAQFAEPVSIFFAIQLTFYGAAACLRAGVHLKLEAFIRWMQPEWLIWLERLIQVLLGGFALFMIIWGASLAHTTWFQSYPEFEYVRVGLVYTAIPISGLITLLFVLEALFFKKERDQHIRMSEPQEHDAEHEREELDAFLHKR